MKNNILKSFYGLLVLLGMAGCNEKLYVDAPKQGKPVLTSFSPSSGRIGTQIEINGEQLRDINKAEIEGAEIAIKYKLSQQTLILELTPNAKTGRLCLIGPSDTVYSDANFIVEYAEPSVNRYAISGMVGSELEIIGSDLDVINKVYFDQAEAQIIFRQDNELVVQIPFVLSDIVTISLQYMNEENEMNLPLEEAFTIIKPSPILTAPMTSNVKEGQIIMLEGENLHLLENVFFGDIEASLLSKENNLIAFRVPTLTQSGVVEVTASYYEGTKSLILHNQCEVFIPKVFHYKDMEIGAHRNADIGNIVNASASNIYFPCYLQTAATNKDQEAFHQIDFTGYANSMNSFFFYGPVTTVGTLRLYYCNGKAITAATTAEALSQEGYSAFLDIETKFMVLSETEPSQNEIVSAVRNESITELSPDVFPNLFNGAITPTLGSVRSRSRTEAENIQTAGIFGQGSVILFKNPIKNKIGLIWIKKINVDYNQTNSSVLASTSSVQVDILYER